MASESLLKSSEKSRPSNIFIPIVLGVIIFSCDGGEDYFFSFRFTRPSEKIHLTQDLWIDLLDFVDWSLLLFEEARV